MRQFIDRYGIALGVILGLIVLLAALPGNATDDRLAASGDTSGTAGESASELGGTDLGAIDGSGTSGTGDGLVTGATDPASAGGTTGGTGDGTTGGQSAPAAGGVTFGSGPDCRSDGRQKGISQFMPPCVAWTPGTDNGGATANGVTRDKIVVVRWIGNVDPATRAILQGAQLSDDPAKVTHTFRKVNCWIVSR